MTITCVNGTGPQWVILWNNRSEFVHAWPERYEGPALTGIVGCGTLTWTTERLVTLPEVPLSAAIGVIGCLVVALRWIKG